LRMHTVFSDTTKLESCKIGAQASAWETRPPGLHSDGAAGSHASARAFPKNSNTQQCLSLPTPLYFQ